VAALAISACGSDSDSGGGSSKTGTISLLQGTAPDYLDPSIGYTTQSATANWNTYLGLYTYAHKAGQAGTKLIPALADGEPTISSDGLTYSMTLRPNLVYSDGTKVKASDFQYTIQRAIKLNWGGKSFYTGYIKGADDYDTGKSKSISGIETEDSSGKIKITLATKYGPFQNLLAFPSAGFIPTGTKMKNLSNNPPPGVGPLVIKDVVPNRSYTLARNPKFAAMKIPDIPEPTVDTNVKIESNTQAEATQVLNNTADIFDWGDAIPPALLPKIQSTAKERFEKVPFTSMYYFFLNTQVAPFNNKLAREAVITGLDRQALSRIDSGLIDPGCYFIPSIMVGHPQKPCPYGDPAAKPDMAKAKALLKQSGLAGTKVTVWGQNRSPRKEWVDYYTSYLNDLGFKAKTKLIADANYFPSIGDLSEHPQTGFADWIQDFPNPSDYYLLLDGNSIQETNNQNFGEVNDPKIQEQLKVLNAIPSDQLEANASKWEALDYYTAQQGYAAVFGYEKEPKFYSNKIDFGNAVFHPVYGNDLVTIRLK
jgi:peptide/nickel transport system substrate-binding protein